MSLISQIAKKIRRRFRKKGTQQMKVFGQMTKAQKLIRNNWNITFSNPEPKRNGEYLSEERLKTKTEIPTIKREPTRQVLRAMSRREFKRHRQLETVKYTQRQAR